jgi:hypothetical protein
MTARPLPPPSVVGYLAEHLTSEELAQLAGARRLAETQGLAPRLSRASVKELAGILADFETPTLGWWRHHLNGKSPKITYRQRAFRSFVLPEKAPRRSRPMQPVSV